MRNIIFYSNTKADMEKLTASLKAQKLTGKFHLEYYFNPLRTKEDVHEFVKKFYESDIFVVGDPGNSPYDHMYVGNSIAIDLAVIFDKNHAQNGIDLYFVYY